MKPPAQSDALMLVADVSNYGGELADAECAGMLAAGVQHVIVRVSLEDAARRAITAQQLAILRRHALPVSGYFFPDYDTRPASFMPAVLALAGDVRTLWVDVEPPDMPDPYTIANWVRAARSVCPVRLGVYTARWVWEQLGTMPQLSDFPLWEARYAEFTGLDVAYGGWSRAAGVQYCGSTTVAGVLCDLSWFDPGEV